MPADWVSELVVAVASVIPAATCFIMVWGAGHVWRFRSQVRMNKRLTEMSRQFRAANARLQPPERPIKKRREFPTAR